MGKYSLFFILILLTSCAHKKVQEIVKLPEVAVAPEAPVMTIKPSENDSFVDYPPAAEEKPESMQKKKSNSVCSNKEIMFLVKQPYVGINSLMEAHKGLIKINQMLYRLLQFYPKIESKEISPADFNALAKETLELSEKIYDLSSKQAGLFSEIELHTRELYYACEEDFNQVLIKVEDQKNSCMLYQQRAYIEDPFGLKVEIGISSTVEMYIQKYFKALISLLVEYNSGKLSLEEFQKNYDYLLGEYQKGHFSAVSLYLKNNVELLTNTTFNLHEACEKSQ